MVDRLIAWFFYATAYACGAAAGLIVLVGFIDWLQTGSWSGVNLLEICYDARVVKAHWFLEHRWGGWVRDFLRATPLSVVLLAFAPLVYVLAARIERR